MTELVYKIPDNPESIEPYDGSVKFTPVVLATLLRPGKIPVIVLGAEALEHNKALSKLVMQAISLQSSIDSQFSVLLAEITKTNAEIVSAMLSEVTSPSLMKGMISNAIDVSTLSDDEKTVLFGLLSLSKKTAEYRNDFAHHLWGLVSGFEDYLLLVPPKYYSAANAVIQQKRARGGMVSDEDGRRRDEFLLGECKMYNKGHVEGLLEEQNYIYGKLREIEMLLQAPVALKQIAFGALIYEPRILSRWDSRRRKAQNAKQASKR